MDVIATTKYTHQSPRKIRLVTVAVSDMPINQAMSHLRLMNKKAAKVVADTLQSAVANATNNFKLAEDSLRIKTLEVNEGPMLKRYMPRSRGQANLMLRRQAHVRVVLTDEAAPLKRKTARQQDGETARKQKAVVAKEAKSETRNAQPEAEKEVRE
jgi:large subunit ribosomal protein L22